MTEENNILPVQCPECLANYKAHDRIIGHPFTCRNCGSVFTVTPGERQEAVPLALNIALKYKLITSDKISRILKEYSQKGQDGVKTTIEDFLLQENYLSRKQLAVIIASKKVWKLRQAEIKFGKIAIARKIATKNQIDKALKFQAYIFKNQRKPVFIGDILVEKGIMTKEQQQLILTSQNRRRNELVVDISLKKIQGKRPAKDGPADQKDFRIDVSPDDIAAVLMLNQSKPGLISLETVKSAISDLGITNGMISDSTLDYFLKDENRPEESIEIARGLAPVTGRNAEIICNFDTEYLKIGAVKSEGAIDYRDRGEIPFVEEGALIAEKKPHVPGKNGVDIFGNIIMVPETSDCRLRCGNGTTLSEDGLNVFAATEGQPKMSIEGVISVLKEIQIKGDVAFETGHVDFDGNVRISGTVQSGFRVRGVDINANNVEGGEIDASGEIVITGGITDAKIKVKGNLRAIYIANSTISAFGNVSVQKEIIDSSVSCSGSCEIESGVIIGSEITAKMGVFAKNIGTDKSPPCKIKAGANDHIDSLTKILKINLDEYEAETARIRKRTADLENEEKQIQKEIAEMAQVQDISQVQLKQIKTRLDEFNSGNIKDQAPDIEKTIMGLERKIKEADEALSGLFERQDSIVNAIAGCGKKAAELEKTGDTLKQKIHALTSWADRLQPDSTVRVTGEIASKTVVSGTRSSIVIEDPLKNVAIREIRHRDKTSSGFHMEIVRK